MNVLVAYATRHGATAEIAERIAARLQAAGLTAEARPVSEVNDVGPYDAVVIGGAAYMFHWLKEATSFAKRHQKGLNHRPLWLFSSGPLGTDHEDKDGQDVAEASRPKEFKELQALLRPRGERVFFGAWDPDAPPGEWVRGSCDSCLRPRKHCRPAIFATGVALMPGRTRSQRSSTPGRRHGNDSCYANRT